MKLLYAIVLHLSLNVSDVHTTVMDKCMYALTYLSFSDGWDAHMISAVFWCIYTEQHCNFDGLRDHPALIHWTHLHTIDCRSNSQGHQSWEVTKASFWHEHSSSKFSGKWFLRHGISQELVPNIHCCPLGCAIQYCLFLPVAVHPKEKVKIWGCMSSHVLMAPKIHQIHISAEFIRQQSSQQP